MLAIFKREIKAYFYSPIAYMLIGFFVLIASLFFVQNLYGQSAEYNSNLAQLNFILMFLIPILTMRILAEDRKNGSEILLITSPVSLTSVVVGKYLAALCVFLVMTATTLIYQIILFSFGKPAVAILVGGYIGFILLGASFIAVGVFASSLTENQIVAAITGILGLLLIWFMGMISSLLGGTAAKILDWFSLFSRYNDFDMGILNLSPIIYYLSFIAVFLFLTIRVIEKRRWSRG